MPTQVPDPFAATLLGEDIKQKLDQVIRRVTKSRKRSKELSLLTLRKDNKKNHVGLWELSGFRKHLF